MKKVLSFVIPIVCALLIIGLGFSIGSPSQNASDQQDDNLLDELISHETVSVPEIFHGFGSPKQEDAVKFLQELDIPGYTLLESTELYGEIPGMCVYGFYPGEDLMEDSIWSGNVAIEVFLYVETDEEGNIVGGTSVDNTVVRVYPNGCGEEECKKLLDYLEEILRFSVPNATPAEFDLFTSTDAYKALMKRCRNYADPEHTLQSGTAVNEIFVAGEESLILISHDAYQYIEITIRTPADTAEK